MLFNIFFIVLMHLRFQHSTTEEKTAPPELRQLYEHFKLSHIILIGILTIAADKTKLTKCRFVKILKANIH